MTLRSFKQKIPLFIIFIVIILSVGAYYFLIYQKNQTSSNDPTQAAAIETQNLLEKIGKLIELPVGEQPQIATVSDASKLPNQPFFAKAKNGDKVLIYNISQKAILYRPSINKIIDVESLVLAQPTTEPVQIQATVSATVTPTVVLSPKPTITPKLTPTPTVVLQ